MDGLQLGAALEYAIRSVRALATYRHQRQSVKLPREKAIIFIPHGIIPFGIIRTKGEISGADVAKGLDAVFARESRAFISTYGRLTTVQANVLKGLAEPNHCKLFSGEFMETYGIRNVGSISKALKRLVADEIIYEFGGEYLFENPFFREWVRRR